MRRLAVILCGSLALYPAVGIAACAPEQVSVRDFAPEVDEWSDGSGKVVRLVGRIETACSSPTSVEVSIIAKSAGGAVVQQKEVWMSQVPPGGQSFDLMGNLPYDPTAVSYEMAVVRTR